MQPVDERKPDPVSVVPEKPLGGFNYEPKPPKAAEPTPAPKQPEPSNNKLSQRYDFSEPEIRPIESYDHSRKAPHKGTINPLVCGSHLVACRPRSLLECH